MTGIKTSICKSKSVARRRPAIGVSGKEFRKNQEMIKDCNEFKAKQRQFRAQFANSDIAETRATLYDMIRMQEISAGPSTSSDEQERKTQYDVSTVAESQSGSLFSVSNDSGPLMTAWIPNKEVSKPPSMSPIDVLYWVKTELMAELKRNREIYGCLPKRQPMCYLDVPEGCRAGFTPATRWKKVGRLQTIPQQRALLERRKRAQFEEHYEAIKQNIPGCSVLTCKEDVYKRATAYSNFMKDLMYGKDRPPSPLDEKCVNYFHCNLSEWYADYEPDKPEDVERKAFIAKMFEKHLNPRSSQNGSLDENGQKSLKKTKKGKKKPKLPPKPSFFLDFNYETFRNAELLAGAGSDQGKLTC